MKQVTEKLIELIRNECQGLNQQQIKKISVETKQYQLLNWITHQKHDQKFFYSNHDRTEEVACIGYCEYESITSQETQIAVLKKVDKNIKTIKQSRYYLSLAFNPAQAPDPLWTPFQQGFAFLPALELKQTKDQAVLSVYLKGDKNYCNDLIRIIENLVEDDQKKPVDPIPLELVTHQPNQDQWLDQVQTVLEKIDEKSLEKVVLSRKSTFRSETTCCPFQMMQALYEKGSNTYHFVFQHTTDWAFIGGTPEQLYQRQGNRIQTESLAGTKPRGKTPEEDHALEQTLLSSAKLIKEHQFVKEYIVEILQLLCETVSDQAEMNVKKLPFVQHLLMNCKGQLKKNVNDQSILQALHPTPAVAGTPLKKSLEIIKNIESYHRGGYAGPLGFIEEDQSQFVVAIRSAVVQEKDVHLFSGAGIVKGSNPTEEYEELNHKIALFRTLFEKKVFA